MKRRVAGKQGLICVLTDRIDGAVVDAGLPDLKIVANIAVGYDNIDVPAVKSRGRRGHQHAGRADRSDGGADVGLDSRRSPGGSPKAIGSIRRGAWKGWALDFMLGMELRGKQLGIIGRGRIGRAVAAKAPAFGMTAVFAKHDMSLDELLVSSDVISIHTPARRRRGT